MAVATTESPGASHGGDPPIRLLSESFGGKPRAGLRRRMAATLPFLRAFTSCVRRERPDVVVASFHDPQYALLAVIASRLSGIPSVFDAQDSWLVMELEHHGAVRNRVRRILERTAMKLATAVTTVSPTLRTMLIQQYRLPPAKVYVVYNAADSPPVASRTLKDIDIIHLGSPRRYYDTLALLDALVLLRNRGVFPKVVFLGCSPEPYVDVVKERSIRLGLSDSVVFEAPVPPDIVPQWLARSRIGIHTLIDHPVYRCAIGIKVFEYLASGLPVVHMGPRSGETAQLIARDGCGLVTTNVNELADALSSILTDPKRREDFAAASRAVMSQHTWKRSAAALREVLDQVEEHGAI